MLSVGEDELLVVSTGVMCNLLLAFSPSRERLVEGGIIERLSILSFNENSTIQLNSVWALMVCGGGGGVLLYGLSCVCACP